MLVPDLRPLSVGEIIDVAIKIWRRHLGTLARIVFVVVAPVEILSALVAASVSGSEIGIESFEDPTVSPAINGAALAAWMAGMFTAQLLRGLAFLISSAAVLRAVSVAYLGGTPDWKESLRAATARLGPLIWLGFLMFGGLVLAAFALLIPSIWLGVAWSLAFPVLIAEGQRGTAALGRSFRLVKGRWWPTFGALALAFLFQFLLGLILGIPLGILTVVSEGDSTVALVLGTIVNVVSSVITTPFMAAVLVLMYFDLRVRKEGFDLQLLSQGVGFAGTPQPADAPWLTASGPAAGAHWGGEQNWGGDAGSWPPPTGSPSTPGDSAPPGGASAGGGAAWPAAGSGWAPPGSGLPTGGSPPAAPPTGPPPTPGFDEPIDPTGLRDRHEPIDPTGLTDRHEPIDPTGLTDSHEPIDPTGASEEPPAHGDQPER